MFGELIDEYIKRLLFCNVRRPINAPHKEYRFQDEQSVDLLPFLFFIIMEYFLLNFELFISFLLQSINISLFVTRIK